MMGSDSLHWLDYAVVALFFIAMIGVGLYFSNKSKSTDQFFGGDKTVPWWLSGISFYMCSFSALAFVMYSALAYKYGWVPVTISWLSVPAVLLGGRFLAVRWRRSAKGSPIDFIASRYTPKMCQALMWLGLPMQILDNAFKLLAIGTVVGVGMGFPLEIAIAVSGAIIIVYTFLGGLKATLVCDFIQFFVILAVVLLLPFLCLDRLAAVDGGAGIVHGMKVFVEKVPAGFFKLTGGQYDWLYMVVFFLIVGANLSTNWSLVQRYYSTKSDKDAKKMAYLVSALLFLGPPLFFFPAMAARVFIPELDMTDKNVMNGVYALLCKTVLPAGSFGLVIAAMFSATMSTLAGGYNAIASVITNEFYGRIKPNATPVEKMRIARIATVFVGGAVIGLTFLMQYAQGAGDLFDVTNKMFAVFVPPIAMTMLCGVLVKSVTKRAGSIALVSGIAVGIASFIIGAWVPVLREMGSMFFITSLTTIFALVVGSVIKPDTSDERKKIEEFFKRITDEEEV